MKTIIKAVFILIFTIPIPLTAGEIDYTYNGNYRCELTSKKLSTTKNRLLNYLKNEARCKKVKIKASITDNGLFIDDFKIHIIASCGDAVDDIEIKELECHILDSTKKHLNLSIFDIDYNETEESLYLSDGPGF